MLCAHCHAPPAEPSSALAGAHPPCSPTGPRTDFRPLTCPFHFALRVLVQLLPDHQGHLKGWDSVLYLCSSSTWAQNWTYNSSSGSIGGGQRGKQVAGRRHAEGRCQSGGAKGPLGQRQMEGGKVKRGVLLTADFKYHISFINISVSLKVIK